MGGKNIFSFLIIYLILSFTLHSPLKLIKVEDYEQIANKNFFKDKIRKAMQDKDLEFKGKISKIIDLTSPKNLELAQALKELLISHLKKYVSEEIGKFKEINLMAILNTDKGEVYVFFKVQTEKGEEKYMIIPSDSIIYIESDNPLIIIKTILKKFLTLKEGKLDDFSLMHIGIILLLFSFLAIITGVIFALAIARWEAMHSGYYTHLKNLSE